MLETESFSGMKLSLGGRACFWQVRLTLITRLYGGFFPLPWPQSAHVMRINHRYTYTCLHCHTQLQFSLSLSLSLTTKHWQTFSSSLFVVLRVIGDGWIQIYYYQNGIKKKMTYFTIGYRVSVGCRNNII